jgi:hypothetical protein
LRVRRNLNRTSDGQWKPNQRLAQWKSYESQKVTLLRRLKLFPFKINQPIFPKRKNYVSPDITKAALAHLAARLLSF